MRTLVVLVFCYLPFTASADVYKWVDERGTTHYSDEPGPGRERVQVAPIQIYQAPGVPAPPAAAAPKVPPEFKGYAVLELTSPADGAAIRNNAGDVAVGVRLTPPLRESDSLKFYLDGQALAGGGRSMSFTLPNLDRGTHSLQVAVIDKAGAELSRSKSVTFHLIRFAQKR